MKKRALALALACALSLSLSLLTACGGNDSGSSSPSEGSSSSQDGSDLSAPGSSQPDVSQPNASQSEEDLSSTSSSSQAQPDASQPEQAQLTLNRTDFSLFKVGATFRLKAAGAPQGTAVTWTSSDEAVATVAQDGTVTYVGAGSATITAAAGELTAVCKVYCKAEETQTPDSGSSSSGSDSSSGSSSSQGGSSSQAVDLKAFADTTISSYELPFMSEMDSTTLTNFLPGLSGLSAQLAAYACQMMPSPVGDLVLVQVKDSKDVASVKDILQARIDYMAGTDGNPGAAWYPEPVRMWTEDSRIVSNGNYVMLVVGSDCDSIVKDFNALF